MVAEGPFDKFKTNRQALDLTDSSFRDKLRKKTSKVFLQITWTTFLIGRHGLDRNPVKRLD